MSVAAWDGFLNDQSNWPAASRIGNATGATTARDTLGDKTFVKRKRMSQEERHLQILQAAVKIIATKGFWGMSLQNISDELGITEAALYHYISSKDDLLNMVLSECYDTIDADEYNAVTAAIVDADGHRVYYYPRYCLNIVLYNLQPRARAAVFGAERRGAEPLAPGPRFLHRPPFAPMGDDLLDELAAAAGRGRGTVLRPVHPGDERHGRSAVPLAG